MINLINVYAISKGEFIMEGISDFLLSNPIISIIGVIFVLTLIFFIIFKSMAKLIMIFFIIFLVMLGYYYYQDPDKVRESCRALVSDITQLSGKRKTFIQDSEEVLKKAKDAPGQVNKMLDSSKKELNN
jgi:hypothetical protein